VGGFCFSLFLFRVSCFFSFAGKRCWKYVAFFFRPPPCTFLFSFFLICISTFPPPQNTLFEGLFSLFIISIIATSALLSFLFLLSYDIPLSHISCNVISELIILFLFLSAFVTDELFPFYQSAIFFLWPGGRRFFPPPPRFEKDIFLLVFWFPPSLFAQKTIPFFPFFLFFSPPAVQQEVFSRFLPFFFSCAR